MSVEAPTPCPADQTLRSSDRALAGPHPPELGLRCLFPRYDLPVVWLVGDRVVLGRDPACGIPLEGRETSRRHAEIRREGPGHVIRDLQSTNGVFSNGVRVQQASLAEGDVVRLGDWVGVVVASASGSESFRSPSEEPAVAPTASTGRRPRASPFSVEQGMLVGPVLGRVLEDAQRVVRRPTRCMVLVGETGTGKELLARALHAWSQRPGEFVAVNCAALPETLAEAELFGYRKGAFTDAVRAHRGSFRSAHQGTLLLDEISKLSPKLQSKLLRPLDRLEVVPLGESAPEAVDVVVVAATQRPLRDLVGEGLFSTELQMRLEQATLTLPTLRERRQEMGYLLVELLRRHAGDNPLAWSPSLVEALCLYHWPGNLRELDHLVGWLVNMRGDETSLEVEHLPDHIQPRARSRGLPSHESHEHLGDDQDLGGAVMPEPWQAGSPTTGLSGGPRPDPLQASPDDQGAKPPVTRERIQAELVATGGNVRRTAENLGVARKVIYRMFTKAELETIRLASTSQQGRSPKGGPQKASRSSS